MSTKPKAYSAGKKTAQKTNRSPWIAMGAMIIIAIIAGLFRLRQPSGAAATGKPREVSAQQAAQMHEQGAFMLDVCEPSEWQEFHMPGATVILVGELSSRLNELPKDQQIVVVCRSGNRSQSAAALLGKKGFQKVHNLVGGMHGWQQAGLQVSRNGRN